MFDNCVVKSFTVVVSHADFVACNLVLICQLSKHLLDSVLDLHTTLNEVIDPLLLHSNV